MEDREEAKVRKEDINQLRKRRVSNRRKEYDEDMNIIRDQSQYNVVITIVDQPKKEIESKKMTNE